MVDRVLLLSYAFPPMSVPEAVLSAKRMGNIPGTSVDVLAAQPWRSWMGADRSMLPYVEERFASIGRVPAGPVVRRLPLGRLGPLTNRPDAMRLLNRRLVRRALQADLSRYDAVVTWSQWHSVHLAGLDLQRRLGRRRLPWLAHLSDPWTANPFIPRTRAQDAVQLRLEGEVFAAADRLLFTSAETVDLSLRGRPDSWRAKARVVPHCFDPLLFSTPQERPPGPLTIRYLGQFYGPRTPEPLYAALLAMEQHDPGSTEDLVVELIGPSQPGSLDTPSARLLRPGLVRALPPVDYVASLERMQSADLLLVVDAPADISVFLPSKLVDYLGARRPVVALSPRGATATLVEEVGGYVADPTDPVAGARALEAGVAAARRNATPTAAAEEVRARYCVQTVGTSMREILEEVSAEAS